VITIHEAAGGLHEERAEGPVERLTFLCAATVTNWLWQRVAQSTLNDQSLVF
jgi:hypothetical protein